MKSTLLLVSVVTSLAAVLLLLPVYGILFLAQQLSYTRDKKGNKRRLVSL